MEAIATTKPFKIPVGGRTIRGQHLDIPDIETLVENVGKVSKNLSIKNFFNNHRKTENSDIYDFESFKKSISSPWEFGMNCFDDLKSQISERDLPLPVINRRRQTWSDEGGDHVSVDRYRSGDPFWIDVKKSPAVGTKVVTVTIDLAASYNVPARMILWRGIVGVILCEILEKSGYRVELMAHTLSGDAFRNSDDLFLTTVPIKKSHEQLDVVKMVNVTSGWFFRIGFFYSYYTQPKDLVFSLGYPVEIGKGAEDLPNIFPDGTHVVENCFNLKSSKEVLESILKKFSSPKRDSNE
jgi:hypothetical protein